jgi:CRISPR/Cas system-associated exonuclease Cas4 (RecB family)
MGIELHYLGWDSPFLPKIVRHLKTAHPAEHSWDLSFLTIATPGSRASRRLSELLALKAMQLGVTLFPPDFITIGSLPERLFIQKSAPVDEYIELVAWITTLETASAQKLQPLFPTLPSKGDLLGWLPFAQDMARLRSELCGERVSIEEVSEAVAKRGESDETARWEAIGSIVSKWLEIIGSIGSEKHGLREDALSGNAEWSKRSIVVAGAVDMPKVTRDLLKAASENGSDIDVLIHAPIEQADHFDRTGCLIAQAWQDIQAPNIGENTRIVDMPKDQAIAVVDQLDQWQNRFANADITIGIAGDSLRESVIRAVELSGRKVNSAFGESVRYSAPAAALSAIASYLDTKSVAALADLIRHPDIELNIALRISLPQQISLAGELDEMRTNHLPQSARDIKAAFGTKSQYLVSAIDKVDQWLAPLVSSPKALGNWSGPIAQTLSQIYEGRSLNSHIPSDKKLIADLETVARILKAQQSIDENSPVCLRLSASQAILFTLNMLSSQMTPSETEGDSISALGWLELALDDASAVVLAGFNEGSLPESIDVDPLLPDSLRSQLGLVDNNRRYARDSYSLCAISSSRTAFTAIAGQRSADGDSIKPSRLYLTGSDSEIAKRAITFYGSSQNEIRTPLLKHGEQNLVATIPLPSSQAPLPESINVTAVRDYLACPFRFYLKYVLKKTSISDDALEMDPRLYGNLAHDSLSEFGKSDFKDSSDADEIYHKLMECAEDALRKSYGKSPLPVVDLQTKQLSRRLRSLAKAQAEERAQGWKIIQAETTYEKKIENDSIIIKGRIDRVDVNENTGEIRVLDYKTGDNSDKPEKRHLKSGEWVDLQLPLYRLLLSEHEQFKNIQLGYISVGKELGKIGVQIADWNQDDLESAAQAIDEAVSGIKNGVFWPPKQPPRYSDGLEGICLDRSIERDEIIRKLTESMK